MDGTVGIVIPAYKPDNAKLRRYVEALEESLDPARIHVEIDVPSDESIEHLEETSATVSVSDRRRGKGAAITAGFDRLDTSILAFVDADGSTPPASVEQIIEPVGERRANLAVGSRRHRDSRVTVHQSRVRRRLGDLFVLVAKNVLPVTLSDYQCGAKAIDRETWQTVRGRIVSAGFAWDIDLICLVDAAGGDIVEVPIEWQDRPRSTVPPVRAGLAFARALFRGWHGTKTRRGSRVHRWVDRFIPNPTPLIERSNSDERESGTGSK